MGRKTQTTAELRELKDRIGQLHMLGYSQREIAAQVGVSQPMVSNHLVKIKDDLNARRLDSYNARLHAKLDMWRHVRTMAYQAYQKSFENKESVTKEHASPVVEDGGHEITSAIASGIDGLALIKVIEKAEGRLPANEYLQTIAMCLKEEAKLEGLIDGDKTTINIFQGTDTKDNQGWGKLFEPHPIVFHDPIEERLEIEKNVVTPDELEECADLKGDENES